MPNYLLEIGTEELPADQVTQALERLKSLMTDALAVANLGYASLRVYGTPRRLACVILDIEPAQPTVSKKVKGPPVKSSFDAQGKPLPPAVGFAQKQGLDVSALGREETAGVEYLIADLTISGQPAASVLAQFMPTVIEQISGERLMRWGSSDLKFSRPIRWLVSLLDDQIVHFQLDGIIAGRKTYGHRILSPGQVTITGPDTYAADLRIINVIVDAQERRQVIEKQVLALAKEVSGKPRRLDGLLLDEVVNLNEWPCAVLGRFAETYLDLPDQLIETVMVHHQRFFPVQKPDADAASHHQLLPYFITIANNDRQEARAQIRRGNERVLRARLADGRFFYFDDQKTKLADRKQALSQLTFQEGLGSYLDKQERVAAACKLVAESLKLDEALAKKLLRAAELCKLDLVTNLVRELPELQGYVGSWYAEQAGETPAVVAAIASHYAPRSTDDSIPKDEVGQLLAALDKLDTLVGVFAIGKRPSGSSDPYALRRQAQGVVDILVDNVQPVDRVQQSDAVQHISLNVSAVLDFMIKAYEPCLKTLKEKNKLKISPEQSLSEVREFIIQRLKVKLLDAGYKREVVDSVLSVGDPLSNLPDCFERCACLSDLLASAEGVAVIRAGVRTGNILNAESHNKFDTTLLEVAAEKELWQVFDREVIQSWGTNGSFKRPSSRGDYDQLMSLLKKVTPAIDNLFEHVMINDPDLQKKNNRHALLRHIDSYFKAVADFPKLQPLLP